MTAALMSGGCAAAENKQGPVITGEKSLHDLYICNRRKEGRKSEGIRLAAIGDIACIIP
jgi:hypothetical protein